MGHRSNLYLQSPKRALLLFEANNSLPFFWLALLDSQTLKAKFEDWEDAAERQELDEEEAEEEGEWNEDWPVTNLVLSRKTFLENAERSSTFVQNHFPDCLPLFTDFVNCIKDNWEAEDTLEMDITEFSAFYDSIQEYAEVLLNDVEAIETDQPDKIKFLMPNDLIAGGTGFAAFGNSEFALFPSYTKALKDRAIRHQEVRSRNNVVQKADSKSLLIAVVVLLLCPVFSYGIYKGYLKEGLSSSVIAIAFLNLGFYIFSLWAVLANWPSQKKNA